MLSVTDADGSRTEYVYDGLGRRSRLIGPDGAWTEYAWGETGYLQGTVDRTPDGAETARHELWVDALGELASVDGCEVWWDSASGIPSPAGVGDEQVLNLPGGVTGVADAWIAPGWRAARPTDETDPWAVLGASVIPEPGTVSGMGAGSGSGVSTGLPAGISLTGSGGLDVAGLEWLGARAYDPAARGFLSTDPLPPVLGAGWDGNPYAYAGNNPLNATDPTGLRPLTDEDLKAYDASSRGAFAAVGDWMSDNWEYVVGGAAIVGGAALLFVPGGQLVGAGLISFGDDVVIQKATTGEVNWAQAGVSGGLGMVGFGAGAAVGRAFNNPVVRGAVEAGVDGTISGGGEYLAQTKDPSLAGLARAAGTGGVSGLVPVPGPSGGVNRLDQLTSTPKRGGAELVAKGQRGVNASIAALLERGDKLLGTEITIKVEVGDRLMPVRPDILAETPDGTMYIIDSKNGPEARLTGNQRIGYPILEEQGGIPVGKNAEDAGLIPGRRIGPIRVQIDKYDPAI
nr:RHS repeat-associated core domain-containing protein [Arthrobacter jiangjiafuii]